MLLVNNISYSQNELSAQNTAELSPDLSKTTPATKLHISDLDIKSKKLSKIGEVVSLLIKEGHLTHKQVKYAARVRSKLSTSRPLLDIIKELKYITEEQISKVLYANRVSMRIGSLLVELGYISEADLEAAFNIQAQEIPKKRLGEVLVKHNFMSEHKMLEVLSMQLGFPYIEPEFIEIDRKLFHKGPIKWYEIHNFIPIRMEGNEVLIAFADPMDKNNFEAAKNIFGTAINQAIASKDSIREAIKQSQRGIRTKQSTMISEDSVVGIVNSIIVAAVEGEASDIHIEPMVDRLRVRFRQDGVLVPFKNYPVDIIPPLTSRMKIMCKADIAEKRRHQDGRIFFEYADMELDLRVSFYVTVHGEKIVLRLLNRHGKLLDIKEIGMLPRMLTRFKEEVLERPSGVVMITGPTGSGKTSTVYSCINYLNNPNTSIITAEDPVEYVIDGISQCSINPKINLTYEETLRHIVRQDPDIVVIGEIRDNFSAEIAVQAALTGHKVLTTFHTEDSIGGLIRLLNMEVEAFLISSTVVSVVAQRLLRKICPFCSAPYEPNLSELRQLGYSPKDIIDGDFQKGKGCSHCKFTGYKGRLAVFELLVVDEPVRDALLNKKTSYEIRKISMESSGLMTLMEDGIVKAATGITSIEEILRCLPRLQKSRTLSELNRLIGDET
ncbi:Secretion system protein E [Candidatus Magnetomoraceae bacterium gMMP-15]